MPFRMGPVELIIILVIVMVIFGVGKLPQIGGSMGKAIREFRKAQDATSTDVLEPEARPEEAEKKVG